MINPVIALFMSCILKGKLQEYFVYIFPTKITLNRAIYDVLSTAGTAKGPF